MQLSISANPPPPQRETPGNYSKGVKSFPGTIIVYKISPNRDKTGVKDPPPGHKVRKFHKCICKLSVTLFDMNK